MVHDRLEDGRAQDDDDTAREPVRDLALASCQGPSTTGRRITGGMWSFRLHPAPEGGTRLVERLSSSAGPTRQEKQFTSQSLIEPVTFGMSQEMLRNPERLAESAAALPDR